MLIVAAKHAVQSCTLFNSFNENIAPTVSPKNSFLFLEYVLALNANEVPCLLGSDLRFDQSLFGFDSTLCCSDMHPQENTSSN